MAGQAAAADLGAAGRDVLLVDAQPDAPYDRPPLSKSVLVGAAEDDAVWPRPADWWDEHGVRLALGTRVTSVDPVGRTVLTDTGDTLSWSALVLATGSQPRRLGVPGEELPGVVCVDELTGADACARALADTARPVRRVVVVGAGFVGCEAAAALRGTGREVTVLETVAQPLVHAVGTEVAAWFRDLHARHGVPIRTGTTVLALEPGPGGRVGAVSASAGTLPADLVVVAVGATPRLDLAVATGCAVQSAGAGRPAAVLVDDRLRTSVPDVYAGGDIAAYPSRFAAPPGRDAPVPYRCPHYNVAVGHGRTIAAAILGGGQPYDDVPTWWTDQYGLTANVVGTPELADTTLLRGGGGDDLLALYVRDDVLVAGLAVGFAQRKEHAALRRLLAGTEPVAAEDVADPGRSLADLVADRR